MDPSAVQPGGELSFDPIGLPGGLLRLDSAGERLVSDALVAAISASVTPIIQLTEDRSLVDAN